MTENKRGKEEFVDSEGNKHTIENSPHTDAPRADGTGSPYDCIKCGKPANSPAYKRYCWDCYEKETNGKVFD